MVNFNPGDSVDLSVCAANGCDGMGVAAAINLGAFGAGTAVGRLLSSAVDAGHITNVASGAMAAQFTTVTWVPNSLGLVGLDLRADAGSIAFTTSMFGAG